MNHALPVMAAPGPAKHAFGIGRRLDSTRWFWGVRELVGVFSCVDLREQDFPWAQFQNIHIFAPHKPPARAERGIVKSCGRLC
jgi:hypothetical protein